MSILHSVHVTTVGSKILYPSDYKIHGLVKYFIAHIYEPLCFDLYYFLNVDNCSSEIIK